MTATFRLRGLLLKFQSSSPILSGVPSGTLKCCTGLVYQDFLLLIHSQDWIVVLNNGFFKSLKYLAIPLVFVLSGCTLGPTTQPQSGAVVTQKKETPVVTNPGLPLGVIEGEIAYRERIALLPGAFVRVVLEQDGKKAEPPVELAEQIFHPSGQVPFRYQLKFDTSDIRGGFSYRIRGQIFSEDERLLFSTPEGVSLEPLGGERRINLMLVKVPLTHQSHMKPVTAAVSRVFQCGDFAFGTRTGIGEIALYLPNGMTVLSQVRSASGVRYQDGDTLFWMKEEQAMLSYEGTFYRQCLRQPEKEARDPSEFRPVDFRAVGNEPPWLLEVVSGHNLNLITDYGQKRLQLEEPVLTQQGDKRSYRVQDEANRVAVTISHKACQDSMADKVWPETVSVWWNGRHLTGCGNFLTPP